MTNGQPGIDSSNIDTIPPVFANNNNRKRHFKEEKIEPIPQSLLESAHTRWEKKLHLKYHKQTWIQHKINQSLGLLPRIALKI